MDVVGPCRTIEPLLSPAREGDPDPVVTVVITTRNRLSFLQEALDSVMRQTPLNWELIVVDDQSTDGTREWLAARLMGRRWTVVLQPEHRERGAARNVGLAKARGKYTLFLDDDDQLAPGALERLVAVIERHPEAVCVGGGRTVFGEALQSWPHRPVRREIVRDISRDLVLGWFLVSGCVLWRTDSLRAAGAWDEGITVSEDHELQLRSSSLGPWVLVPDIVLRYRSHAGQTRATYDQAHVAHRQIAAQIRGVADRLGVRSDRVLRSWGLLWSADQAFRSRRPRPTLTAYARAVFAAPAVMTSPILRPIVVRRVGWAMTHLAGGLRAKSWQPAEARVSPGGRTIVSR